MARDPDDDARALKALRQFQALPDAAIMVASVVGDDTDDGQIVALRLSHHSPLHLIAMAEALIGNAIDELEANGAWDSDALPRLRSALASLVHSSWPLQPRCARALRRRLRPLRPRR
jgi:hypothetical protein